MGNDSGSYKGTWRVSVKCEFLDSGQRVWHYCDKDKWTVKDTWAAENGSPNGELLRKRAKRITKAVKDSGINLLDQKSSVMTWLCANKNKKSMKVGDFGATTLFNHIVVSQSLKLLTTIATVMANHRTVEMQGLAPGQPQWFYTPPAKKGVQTWKATPSEYVVAFPGLFFKTGYKPKGPDYYEPMLMAHRQMQKVSVIRYEVAGKTCTLDLRLDFEICRYERGSLCKCIPIPGEPIVKKNGDPDEPFGVYTPETVVTSPAVEEILQSLSDIWQDKAEAVLVVGPPGSGKENYALSIPYGNGRTKEKVPRISLASGDEKSLERQIFGYQQDDGSIEAGLIAKAKGTALFVDEAHHPTDKPGVRALLLRVLEAKEYYPAGSLDLQKVEDVQWIFASSLPLDGGKDSLGQVPPDDFWTRMTHLLRVDHPLDLQAFRRRGLNGLHAIAGEQKKVLHHLFKFTWWDRTKSHFGVDPLRVLCNDNHVDLRDLSPSDQLSHGHIKVLLKSEIDNKSTAPLDRLADNFADCVIQTIGSVALAEVSIRGLRSMVSRIFAKCVGAVTAGEEDWDKAMSKDKICEVIKEIQSIARIKQRPAAGA